MKFLFILLLSACLVLPACERRERSTAEAAREPGAERSYLAERDHYIDAMQVKLKEIEIETDKLEQDAAYMKGKSKGELTSGIADVRALMRVVERRLDHLGGVAGAEWTDLRTGVDDAMNRLEQTYKDVASKHAPMTR